MIESADVNLLMTMKKDNEIMLRTIDSNIKDLSEKMDTMNQSLKQLINDKAKIANNLDLVNNKLLDLKTTRG